jgi:DNA-binding SARP family transcriptional activator
LEQEVATVIRFRLFGSVELTDPQGREVGALLTRPKRLAVLAYLVAAHRTGYTRRDEVLALFWPELDASRARNALNQSVRTIRRALGGSAVESRGDDEIRVDQSIVWCDVAAFHEAVESARHDEALFLYRGDLLQGFFAPGAGGFEKWLERERAVLRRAAMRSARSLAEARDQAGNLTTAISWARRAVELSHADEPSLRHLLDLLDRLGDRAGALQAYDSFARWLRDDLGASPSAETSALADRIRQRERPLAARNGGRVEVPTVLSRDPALPAASCPGYQFLGVVGRGGMATVYLARDLKHERPVAVKVLHSDVARHLGPERFLREIQITARLAHPHVLPLLDSGTVAGVPFYVMPYIRGDSLRARLARDGTLGQADAFRMVREIAGALDYAHAQGIVHRDIKPENILLEAGHAVVADFGIADAVLGSVSGPLSTPTSTGDVSGVFGSPGYMSPEQAAGHPQVGARSDIYSLACVAQEMLTGMAPSPDTISAGVRHREEATPPAQTPGAEKLPDEVWCVIRRATASAPEDRHAAAGEFAAALEHAARPTAPGAPIVAARRSIRRIHVAIASLAVLLAVGTTFSVVRPRASGASPNRIAVFPLRVHAGQELQYLSEGAMDLLGQALDGVGDLRRVDPNALLSRIGPNVGAVGSDRARTIATTMGAGRWILGTIVPIGGTIRLSLSLYDTRHGSEAVAWAAREDSATRLDAVVSATMTDLFLAQQVGGGARLRLNPAITPKFEALKAYLQAEASLRRGYHDRAARLLEHAVAVDSEFALAWYRLSFARSFIEGEKGLGQGGMEAVDAAMRHQLRLAERDRQLVAFYHALVHGDGQLAERRAAVFTRTYPDDAEGWTMLGITQVWHAWQRGRDPAIVANRAYRRALALDPEHRDARLYLTRMAMASRDYDTIDSIVREGVRQGGAIGGDAAAFVSAFGRRDAAAQRELVTALVRAQPERRFMTLAINVAKHTDDLEGAARLARLMTDGAAAPAVRKQGHYVLALLAMARGRRTEANAELRAMAGSEGEGLAAYDVLFRAWLAATPALAVPAAELRSVRVTLERWQPPTGGPDQRGPAWHSIEWAFGPAIRLYLLGLVTARLGEEDGALAHASELERLRLAADSANLLTDLALEIRALAAAENGRKAEALAIIQRQKLTVRWMYDILNPLYFRPFGRLLRADLLRHTGRHADALAWYSSFAWSASPEFVYLAPVNFGQAQSHAALGHRPEAEEYYRRFIERWRDADPELQPQIARARQRLAELERR